MKMIQCSFKKEGSETYTQGWVDAKKIKNATRVQLLNLDETAFWIVLHKGSTVREKKEINTTFSNNFTQKFGNKS
jgi:hypothetical protein